MKDKNSLIGWILIGLLFVGFLIYSNYNAKEQAKLAEEQAKENAEAVGVAEADEGNDYAATEQTDESPEENPNSILYKACHGTESTYTIQNEFLKLDISSRGGKVVKAEILDSTYKSQAGGNVVIFDGKDNLMSFRLNDSIYTNVFYFDKVEQTKDKLALSVPIGDGKFLLTYELMPNSYVVKMDLQAENLSKVAEKQMGIYWRNHVRQQEKGSDFEDRYCTVTWRNTDDDTDDLSANGELAVADEDDKEFPMKWLAYKTQFFSQILIADKPFEIESMYWDRGDDNSDKTDGEYLKTMKTEMTTNFDPTGKKPTYLMMYLGPNKFSTLQENEDIIVEATGKEDLKLKSIVYLGWPIVRWLNRYIFIYLFDFMTGWGLNMGIILILITVIVKICVYPLQKKSFMSTAYMRALRPKIEEINKKYPNKADAMQKQQEVMQLYSQYGVSPMGGCLPMLIQMPIWIALFNFIPNAIELRGQSFLWADDLSSYDGVIQFGTSIWGIGDHLSLFCVLWCLTTWINTWISMRQQSYNATMSAEQQQSMGCMKWFSYLMPLIFFFSFNSYASGLNLYYFVSGLISILTMWYLRTTTDDSKLLAVLEKRKKERKANPQKHGSLMERLQAMQEQQKALQEQRRNEKH